METTLIFQEGLELPHFAAFVLLDSPDGRQKLKQYYESYLAVARAHGAGFVLDSPTWRANPDWADKLGYDAAALKAINVRSMLGCCCGTDHRHVEAICEAVLPRRALSA